MDIAPFKVMKIVLHYDNCRSIEMRLEKITCNNGERRKISDAVFAIEEECARQASGRFKIRG